MLFNSNEAVQNKTQVRLLTGSYLRVSLSFPHWDSVALVTEKYTLIWRAMSMLFSFILILSEWSQREAKIDADVLTTQHDL